MICFEVALLFHQQPHCIDFTIQSAPIVNYISKNSSKNSTFQATGDLEFDNFPTGSSMAGPGVETV